MRENKQEVSIEEKKNIIRREVDRILIDDKLNVFTIIDDEEKIIKEIVKNILNKVE